MLPFRRRRESDLERELRSHLDAEADERIDDGMDPRSARFAARRALGNLPHIQEDVRAMWGGNQFETFLQDLRYAGRVLRKNPGFAAAAVLALALGTGANTAVFSVYEAELLRALPFPHADRLVRVWESYGAPGATGPESYPNFRDWREWNRSFSGMAAFTKGNATLTGHGDPRQLSGLWASAELCRILGLQPVTGRLFRTEEDQPGGNAGANSVLLSEPVWHEIFDGRRDAIGQQILLEGSPYTVVGIVPAEIDERSGFGQVDFVTTIAPLAEARPGARANTEIRDMSFLRVIGRLRPDVTLAQAQSDMDRVAGLLHTTYPAANPQTGVTLQGLRASVTGEVKPVLTLLLACAGFVLLVSCADIAGLVLARAGGRQREMAVRSAIGAGRWRIVRQLFVESLVMSVLGCTAGLWLAMMLATLLGKALRLTALPRLDLPVLAFSVVLAIFAAAIFGLAPVVHYFKTDLMKRLRESSLNTSEGAGQRRAHGVLVVAQMALAMILLSSSGLLAMSLLRLQTIPLGFSPGHVLTFPVAVAASRYPQAQRGSVLADLTSRLKATPGVVAVGAGGQLPLQGSISRTVISNVAGAPVQRRGVAFAAVTPEYFRAVGIAIRRGREFTDADTAAAQPVVILNEAAARRYFPKGDGVGQQVTPEMWNGSGGKTMPRTVAGVVADVKLEGLRSSAVPAIYWPVAQIPSDAMYFVSVRTAGDPLQLVGAVREQLRAVDRDLPLYDVFPLEHYVDQQLALPRSTTVLVGGMALLALVLTAVGLYGVIAYSVARRTREIGIRTALGASRGEILRSFLRSGLMAGILGVAIGLPGAIAASRLLKSLLYGVDAQKGYVLAAGGLILIVVAALASFLPAHRATKVDPMNALRYE